MDGPRRPRAFEFLSSFGNLNVVCGERTRAVWRRGRSDPSRSLDAGVIMFALLTIALLTITPDASADAAPDATAHGPPDAGLCQGRGRCRIAQRHNAGADGEGAALEVVRLALDPRDNAGLPPEADLDRCVAYEYVLVRRKAQDVERRPLLRLCNDGYGAAGMGEDRIEVGANRVILKRRGGSAWRWISTWTLQLSPLRLLGESTQGFWALGPNEETCAWSRDTWSGECAWSVFLCTDDGDVPNYDQDSTATEVSGRYRVIPQVQMPSGWSETGWKSAALGSCSVQVDSDDGPFIVHGGIGEAGDAILRVVAGNDGVFYIEIVDDYWQQTAESWVDTDHIEIWTHSAMGYMDQCIDRSGKPKQWGIDVFDDVVRSAANKPQSPPQVTRHPVIKNGKLHAMRLRVAFGKHPGMITVVYSDSDERQKQERLIATSALKYNTAWTLGGLRRIPQSDAVCVVDHRVLKMTDAADARGLIDALDSTGE